MACSSCSRVIICNGTTVPSTAFVVEGMDDRLVAKLRSSLTGSDAELFVRSFAKYLQHGDDDCAFVIDLDGVWEWMGFSCKYDAQRLLRSEFQEDVHYKTDRKNIARDTTMMTVDTFKNACMVASTPRPQR